MTDSDKCGWEFLSEMFTNNSAQTLKNLSALKILMNAAERMSNTDSKKGLIKEFGDQDAR